MCHRNNWEVGYDYGTNELVCRSCGSVISFDNMIKIIEEERNLRNQPWYPKKRKESP